MHEIYETGMFRHPRKHITYYYKDQLINKNSFNKPVNCHYYAPLKLWHYGTLQNVFIIIINHFYNYNKKAQLSLTNPRDACEKFARFT